MALWHQYQRLSGTFKVTAAVWNLSRSDTLENVAGRHILARICLHMKRKSVRDLYFFCHSEIGKLFKVTGSQVNCKKWCYIVKKIRNFGCNKNREFPPFPEFQNSGIAITSQQQGAECDRSRTTVRECCKDDDERWYYLSAHWLYGDVLLSNSTFLIIAVSNLWRSHSHAYKPF